MPARVTFSGGSLDVTIGGDVSIQSAVGIVTFRQYNDASSLLFVDDGDATQVNLDGDFTGADTIDLRNVPCPISFATANITVTDAVVYSEDCVFLPACPSGCGSYTATGATGSHSIPLPLTAPKVLDFSGLDTDQITAWFSGTVPTGIVAGDIGYFFQGQNLNDDQINGVTNGLLPFLGSGSRLAGITGGTLNITDCAAPALDSPAVSASVEVTHPSTFSIITVGAGAFYTLAGSEYFWSNVDSTNTDPAPSGFGPGYEVAIASTNTAIENADAFTAVVTSHGYTSSGSGATRTFTRTTAGQGVACTQNEAAFTFSNEYFGANASNQYVDQLAGNAQKSITGKGVTVITS